MNAWEGGRSGSLLVVALLIAAGAGGCRRAGETGDSGKTSGMSGPAAASDASDASGKLTGPAITPAPAPPRGAQ